MSRNQRSQETFPLHRVVRQLKSEPRCPTCPGWAPAPRFTSCLPQLLMNKQISQGVGLTLSTGPEVLVPNSFLVSTLWSHQPMLAERGWGQGRASWLGGDRVVRAPREVSQSYRPLCLAPPGHWDSQSHLPQREKQGTWVRIKPLALFCNTTRPGVWRESGTYYY